VFKIIVATGTPDGRFHYGDWKEANPRLDFGLSRREYEALPDHVKRNTFETREAARSWCPANGVLHYCVWRKESEDVDEIRSDCILYDTTSLDHFDGDDL